MLVTIHNDVRYEDRYGTFRTTLDGQDVYVAYIHLGHDRVAGHIVVEASGPSEVQAAERCMLKCKMLGDIMTLNIQEGFWAPLRRAEEQVRNKVFGALAGKGDAPGTTVYAETDDDKKDEPS